MTVIIVANAAATTEMTEEDKSSWLGNLCSPPELCGSKGTTVDAAAQRQSMAKEFGEEKSNKLDDHGDHIVDSPGGTTNRKKSSSSKKRSSKSKENTIKS